MPSVSHLKLRGSLSHLGPRALLLVITRAAITRRRHMCTHFQCASRDRQTSLRIPISMQSLPVYCRTRAPASVLLWLCVFRNTSVGPAAGLQGPAITASSLLYRIISEHKKGCSVMISFTQFGDLNIFWIPLFSNVGFIPPREAFGGWQRHFGHPLKRYNRRTRWWMVIEGYQIKSCWIVSYQRTDEQATAKTCLSTEVTLILWY